MLAAHIESILGEFEDAGQSTISIGEIRQRLEGIVQPRKRPRSNAQDEEELSSYSDQSELKHENERADIETLLMSAANNINILLKNNQIEKAKKLASQFLPQVKELTPLLPTPLLPCIMTSYIQAYEMVYSDAKCATIAEMKRRADMDAEMARREATEVATSLNKRVDDEVTINRLTHQVATLENKIKRLKKQLDHFKSIDTLV